MSRLRLASVVKCLSYTLALVLLCAHGSAQTPVGSDPVVNGSTVWMSGIYNLNSLTVTNGAVLTIGGGSTITVTGEVLVQGNSSIVMASINNSAQVNGIWQGAGVSLKAGSVEVDGGSSINADGLGYLPGAGPGGGTGGYRNNGGSYGGAGGGQASSTIYGSSTAPMDIGSGGDQYPLYGGAGGGAIRLIVSGTLANYGSISANGLGATGDAGGGAGGSIYVTANALLGAGAYTANGGTNPVNGNGNGGGGGRVAIYFASAGAGIAYDSSTATAGSGIANSVGVVPAPGTVAFFNTSGTNQSAQIYQNFTLPVNTNVTYSQLSVQNGGVFTIGGGSTVTVTGGVVVTRNSSIVAQSINTTAQVNGVWAGQGVTINAGSVQVDAGSTINADGQGYAIARGPGLGVGGYQTNGGSYGGAGGGQAAGTVYGTAGAPVELGSGGAQYSGSGGAGGGAIRMVVSGTLTNNGVISANGGAATTYAGGGSGGAIYVTTATLAGAGDFAVNGGSNGGPNGDGGGGGRIAVYYASGASFTGFGVSTATGGVSGEAPGGVGTVVFFDTSVPNNNVSVYQSLAIPAGSNVQYNSLNVASGGSVTIGGGSQLTLTQALHVSGKIVAQSINNTAKVNGAWQGKGIKIVAGSVQIDPSGSINADKQGYAVLAGPGAGVGNYQTNGGSYGGIGGGQLASSVYGSATAPVDLGSGGAQYGGTGGTGGGAIELLVSGTLTNNGLVSANGGATADQEAGAGSGGSIYVAANTVAGTGTYTANGGVNTAAQYGFAGGGGRVSIYYVNASGSTGINNATAAGGLSPGGTPGAAGSVTLTNAPLTQWVEPTAPVIHGSTVPLVWFTDGGSATTVMLEGPHTQTIAQGSVALSTSTLDTTAFPDGAYELRLLVLDATGKTIQELPQPEVINNSVVWHSGTLSSSQEWTSSQGVHALDGIVIVPAGVTLTIDPGTIVKALPGATILVQPGGTLIALGGANAPVIFTTFDDSTAGGNTDFNQGISVPSPGEWGGISVQGGGVFQSNGNTVVRYAQNLLSGTLSASTTLLATQVYEAVGNVTVPSGVTLTIAPGAIVKFDVGAGLDFQPGSTLVANGTLAQPIYMTSINDASIGRASGNITAPAPAPGDWNTILIDGATASFNHVQMHYGGGPLNTSAQAGMIETTEAANVTIANSTLAYAFFIGIQTGYPNGGGDTITITDTSFYSNEDRAINVFPGSTAHVVNDTFDSNAAGVFAHGGTVDIANSVISNSVGTQFGGIGVCCGSPVPAIVNTDVYTTTAGVSNYVGLSDPTGTLGNISANPVYMNGPQHDYRPTYGSPLIDAANGTVANYPTTDAFGQPRYNDPLVLTKTGAADSNGKFPDIGAFEFVQTAPSDIDFTVDNVQGPSTTVVGTRVQVSWTVTNIGMGTAYGPWHDSVYLVTDPNTNPAAVLAGTVLEGTGVTLGPGASYNASATVTVPGAIIGSHHWQVKTNVRGEVFEGANTANNTATSINPVAVDLTELTPDAAALPGVFAATGQSAYYKIVSPGSQPISVKLTLTGSAPTGSVQLFIGAGYVPSPQHYDYQQVEFGSTTASLVIPAGSAQTYYVTAYAQSLPGGQAAFTVQAGTVQFSLTGVTPGSESNYGDGTLTFIGGGFTSSTTFQLIGSSGTAYNPTATFLSDSGHAELTFDLKLLPADTYSAAAVNGATVTLPNAFTVSTNVAGTSDTSLSVNVQAPSAFRAGFPSVVTLNYINYGGSDISAPIIWLTATGATLSRLAPDCPGCNANFPAMYQGVETNGLVLGINNQGPAGVLPAGSQGSIQFLATPTADNVTFNVQFMDQYSADWLIRYTTQGPIMSCGTTPGACLAVVSAGVYSDASDLCAAYVPPFYNPAGFTRTCMQLLVKTGFQGPCTGSSKGFDPNFQGVQCESLYGGNLNQLIADDSTQLSSTGIYESEAARVLAFEFQNDGLDTFNRRYHQGAFGYGASHDFDTYAQLAAIDGAPVVFYPDGSARRFPTVNPAQSNQYLGIPGDYGVMTTAADGSLTLTERDGTQYNFNPPAASSAIQQLAYIQDTNGNQINLTYTNGLMTSAVDSHGNTLSYVYDSLGHITQATDPVGRVTTYGYDVLNDKAHSTFLTSITTAAGTTSISWNEGGAHGVGYFDDSCVATYCEPAIGINSITHPDGSHIYYTYDAVGRLTGSSRDGGADAVTYTYGAQGTLTVTDALGNSFQQAPNQYGALAQTTDPLQAVTQYTYDLEQKVTGVRGALGTASSLSYDSQGNIALLLDPMGNQQSIASDAHGNTLSFTDANGNATAFSYDAQDNLLAVAGPDGNGSKYTYDKFGNATSVTNARGKTIQFAYNPQNLLTSRTYSNGSQVGYTYDAHNNLQTITAANGVTTYTYDAADRVTAIAYPNGQYIHYAYNAGGQRTGMTDSTGFSVQYGYDAAGRLASLTSGSNAPIAAYTYDAAGNLARKTFGNGTYTSYVYDTGGKPTQLVNYGSGGNIVSQYNYTFDALGRQTAITGPPGPWAIGYDPDNQVTSATVPGAPVAYTYDSAGNRLAASAAAYNVNNLNEYTSAGGTNYTYDADGNLVSGGGWTYTYDDENRLVAMTGASDSWTYQYDGLGDRVSATHNGVVTQYLNDPSGFGNVEAELNGTGQVIAHYTYGLGLTSAVPSSGTPAYYNFDASGNTVQMTSASGAVVNNYVYLPFGEKVSSTVGVPNPFTYVGQFGVMDEGSGLYYMHARWYSPSLGRFVQRDPTGLASGDANPYRYSGNDSTNASDPAGLRAWLDILHLRVDASANAAVQESQSRGVGLYNAGVQTQTPAQAQEQIDNTTNGGVEQTMATGLQLAAPAVGAEIELTENAPLNEAVNMGAHKLIEKVVTKAVGADEPKEPGEPEPEPAVPSKSYLVPCLEDMANYFSGNRLFKKPPPPVLVVPSAKSKDPNGKITSGFGDQGYVPAGVPIVYTIYFENQPSATLPAQIITVTDSLASNLDWSTVQFNQIAFNNATINVPSGTQTYTTQTTVSTDPNPVSVSASLNPSTGVLTWKMQSVDATTGSAPANPLAGFLPPNDAANAGSGSVTFTVKPKSGLANGTSITNQASIVFDVNAAIATNSVINTLDTSSVSSSINPLPAGTTATALNVSWSGSDASGSGIAYYNIYVSQDGGAYALWLSATTLTTSTYTAITGHSYTFYSIATNNVGLVQDAPISPQTIAVNQGVPTVTVSPALSSIGTTQALGVSVAVASPNTGGALPTGTVTLSSGTYTSAATTLSSGAAAFTIPGGSLATGVDTVTATYLPDTTSSALYTGSTGTAQVSVGVVNSAPVASLSPTAGLTFTAVSGTTSAAQTVQLTNNGTATLTITGVTLAGTGAGSFADTSACGTSLPAGYSCNISVTFTPSSVASFSATLSFADNASGTPQSITLTGTGTAVPAPVVSLAPASLTFTSASGTTSAAQTVTLSNTGNAVLSITGITLGGSGATSFAQTNTCGTSLAAGSSCPISVVFTPGSVGGFSATISIADNASGATQTVGLTGTGAAPLAPIATISPVALTFTAIVGTPSVAQTAKLSNTGNATLAISGIALTGSGAANFAQTNTCGTSLAAGANCTVSIVFTAPAAAGYSGSLSIADNASGSPQTVALTGTGTAPPTITFTVPNHTYGDAPFTVTAISNSSGAITYSVISGPATISGSVVTLTGAGAVVLQASQAAAGSYASGTQNATFTVASEAQTITFTAPASPVTYGVGPIALSASSTSGLTVVFSVSSGPASISGSTLTITGAGPVVVAADQSGNANYAGATEVTRSITVNKGAPAAGLTASPNPVLVQNTVTLTATIGSSVGTPTGSVVFSDSGTTIGTATLNAGIATLSVSILGVGSHSITAVYGGDGNFNTASSAAISETVEDFTLTIGGSGSSQTVQPGGTATYTLPMSPSGGTTFPAAVTFAATGLPAGFTATFSPTSLAAGSSATNVALTIQVPLTAKLEKHGEPGRSVPLIALGLLVLPFLGGIGRSRKWLHRLALLTIVFAGMGGMGMLTGCGGGGGGGSSQPQTYTVTVTATSGALSHSTTVTLIVQ